MPPTQTIEPAAATERKGAETAERILDVAEELFAERGFSDTTLRDVAKRVGIQNPSLYNHFDSKEALYSAVLERGIGPVLETLSEFLDAGPEAQADPEKIVASVMGLLSQRPQLPRLIQHETLRGGQHLTPVLRKWMEPVFARGHRMVEVAPGAQGWSSDQITHLVLAMYHIVVGYFTIAPLYRELSGEDLLSAPSIARQTQLLGEISRALLTNPDRGRL